MKRKKNKKLLYPYMKLANLLFINPHRLFNYLPMTNIKNSDLLNNIIFPFIQIYNPSPVVENMRCSDQIITIKVL